MVQMAPPIQEVIIEESNIEEFNFSKLGVYFDFSNIFKIFVA